MHNLQELTNNTGFTFTQNKFPIVTDSIEFKQFQTPKIQKNKHVFFYDSQTNLMDLNSGSKEEINKKAEKVKQENGMSSIDDIPFTMQKVFKDSFQQVEYMKEYDYQMGRCW